jgi:hypothetical protein
MVEAGATGARRHGSLAGPVVEEDEGSLWLSGRVRDDCPLLRQEPVPARGARPAFWCWAKRSSRGRVARKSETLS